MERYRNLIEKAIADYINADGGSLASAKWRALDGGGRTRAMLTLAWCEVCGGRAEDAVPFALAVEMVQAMSLVHDDLPCMDNAETRRGKPALHRSQGEAVAVLTGDALLADAFLTILRAPFRAAFCEIAARVLAQAASRMADGQAAELTGDGCWQRVASGKTASLFEAACDLGAIAAGATTDQRLRAVEYGRALGLAYQLADDIRDGDGAAKASESPLDSLRELLEGCGVYRGGEAGKWLSALPKAIYEEAAKC